MEANINLLDPSLHSSLVKSRRHAGLLVLALCGLTPGVFASNLDCRKAETSTEKMICDHAPLTALDDELQQAYAGALAATDATGKKSLREEQRHWITYTRNICQDEACLAQAYTARIAVLARHEKDIVDRFSCETPAGGKTCVNVVTYRDPSIRIRSFDQSLAQTKQAGKIIGCSHLIDLPVGTVGSNHSYGGICILQRDTQRTSVEICNDDMFGHFGMRPIEPRKIARTDLVDFTYRHCFGG